MQVFGGDLQPVSLRIFQDFLICLSPAVEPVINGGDQFFAFAPGRLLFQASTIASATSPMFRS
jgi:hypothetical protein